MSLHDEEMRKRREKREAQRRRQEAERRKLKMRLAAAVLILAFCGGGLWYLTRNSGIWDAAISTPSETKPPERTMKEPSRVSAVAQEPITKIHIKAAGDLNITDSVIQAGMAASGYSYSRAFQDVAAILADADLTVLNYEGNACGEPYGTATTSAPGQLLYDLRAAGVDLVQTANSCVINNGLIGLTSTLRTIRDAGIEPMGSYGSVQEFRTSKGYTITDVRGVKVAFAAFTKGVGGRGMPTGQEQLVNLLYEDYDSEYQKVAEERIQQIMKNVAAEKPDLTVVMLHWGSEYNDDISKSQKKIVSLLQKQGADVILGTHPHTLQPIVFDQNQGTLVAYSLGDFFGDAERGGTNYSIILDLEITKDSTTGTTKVTNYSYTPIYTVKDVDCPGYQKGERRVVRIDKAIEAYNENFLDKVTKETKESMEYALTRIADRLVMKEDTKK